MKVNIGPYTEYNKKTKKTSRRKIKVKIDPYDVWNLDQTLALIIIPSLKLMKKKKKGSPFVYDEDVPEELSSKRTPINEDGTTDSNWHKRWEWILNEMIWSFEQSTKDWEKQYHSGKVDVKFVITPESKNLPEDLQMFTLENGPKHTRKLDKEGYNKHYLRMQNGFRLFGEYYTALWT
jgi:hypothetical protein